jgi:hypothetical protein
MGPQSEKLSAGQIELLGARAWSPRAGDGKGIEVSSGRKRLPKREYARRNALSEHLSRREEIIAGG